MASFAIIPAAGKSLRMGKQHKLGLSWPPNRLEALGRSPSHWTVFHNVLDAWQRSRVDHVCVVLRREDEQLIEVAQEFGAEVLQLPHDLPHMKDSISAGLQHTKNLYSPSGDAVVLIAPADLPTLKSDVIDLVLECTLDHQGPVIPRYHIEMSNAVVDRVDRKDGKRGHPIAMPLRILSEIEQLGDDQGLNVLVQRYSGSTKWVDLPGALRPVDIDTPEEYERLLSLQAKAPTRSEGFQG